MSGSFLRDMLVKKVSKVESKRWCCCTCAASSASCEKEDGKMSIEVESERSQEDPVLAHMSVFLPDSTHLLVLLAKSDSIVAWTILYDGIRLHELFQQQPMLRYISYSNESSKAELTGSAMVLFRPLDTALTADAVSKISSALEGLLGSTSISVEGRLYDTQSPVTATDFIGSGPHILVFNAMTPSSNSESSFNDWYAQEHIPLLSRVPGWRASRRFTLVFATRVAPQYLALHAFRDFSAFDTSEYRDATTTPWRAEVIGNVVEKERIVLEIDNDRSLLGDDQPAASSD